MKKQGFTLIELLAVIVILAIIALIAVPIVINIINDSRKKSNDISIEYIVDAAELYYADEVLKGSTNFPKTFEFPSDELNIDGKQPESGTLTIYEDGTVYMKAKYGNKTYVKFANNDEVTVMDENGEYVSSPALWQTDGNGTITLYNKGILQSCAIVFEYYDLILNFNSDENYDSTKTLKENLKNYEKSNDIVGIREELFPEEINKEMDKLIDKIDSDNNYINYLKSLEVNQIKELYPYYYEITTMGDIEIEELPKTKIYKLLNDNIPSTIIIPNKIMHSDGTIENIKNVDAAVFRDQEGLNGIVCSFNRLITDDSGNLDSSLKINDVNLIVSEGIENIGNVTLLLCFINNVQLPSTLKTVGEFAFAGNKLTNLQLPEKLETIGEGAFTINMLNGSIIIPKSVINIGENALGNGTANEEEFNELSTEAGFDFTLYNKINKIEFEDGSKIETIGESAFAGNKYTTVTIPSSIKSIGPNAFNSTTLTSAIIKRAQGSDLTVDPTAFGTITPVYQP